MTALPKLYVALRSLCSTLSTSTHCTSKNAVLALDDSAAALTTGRSDCEDAGPKPKASLHEHECFLQRGAALPTAKRAARWRVWAVRSTPPDMGAHLFTADDLLDAVAHPIGPRGFSTHVIDSVDAKCLVCAGFGRSVWSHHCDGSQLRTDEGRLQGQQLWRLLRQPRASAKTAA